MPAPNKRLTWPPAGMRCACQAALRTMQINVQLQCCRRLKDRSSSRVAVPERHARRCSEGMHGGAVRACAAVR
eukprot:278335-Chlamydomonas_euryale.AAC.16